MNDIEKDAQNDGYSDGLNNHGKSSRYCMYSNLQAAYDRGYSLGRKDYESREGMIHEDA